MSHYIKVLVIFVFSFFIYFGVATQFTFQPKWVLDYFNPMAQSLLQGRLDLPQPPDTYDLSNFEGKWYAPWGPMPAFMLMPIQLILGRFIPTVYITIVFASLNIVLMYVLLLRIKKEFFPGITRFSHYVFLVFFALGTTHLYVGTLGSVWHTEQMVSNFIGTLGLFIIFKKKRNLRDYVFSIWMISMALLARATIVMLFVLPAFLFYWDYLHGEKLMSGKFFRSLRTGLLIFIPPLLCMSLVFFTYNYLRFKNPFEYGFSYINEAPYLEEIRKRNGVVSINNIPTNFKYMVLEIPSFTYDKTLKLDFNLNGNSIFFLSSPFLAIFLASPFLKKAKKLTFDPYIGSLWLAAILIILPSLMHYGSGWMQFGYRYSLDITAILVILSVFGMKGKINLLYVLGVIFSIVIYLMGIYALM